MGWAVIGLALLGRPAEPRPAVATAVIPSGAPSERRAFVPPPVTVHDPLRASAGLNLVTAGEAAEVLLLDMDGTVLHRWHRDLAELVDGGTGRRTGTWQRARLLGDGRLLVIVGGVGLVALDRDSNVSWKAAEGAHDAFEILPDDRIVVLSRRPRARQDLSRGRIIVEDVVTVVGADGAAGATLSLVDALLGSPYTEWRAPPLTGDILQTDVLALLPGEAGDLLLSMGRPRTLVVLAPSTRQIVSSETGSWHRISDLEVLPDGGLLVVDTLPSGRRSRVRELAPDTRAVRWTWTGAPLDRASGGTASRLPNGNTLVTASDDGATVELAPDGSVVWALGPRAPASSATAYETERVPASSWEGP